MCRVIRTEGSQRGGRIKWKNKVIEKIETERVVNRKRSGGIKIAGKKEGDHKNAESVEKMKEG